MGSERFMGMGRVMGSSRGNEQLSVRCAGANAAGRKRMGRAAGAPTTANSPPGAWAAPSRQPSEGQAEAGLAALLEACEKAVEEIMSAVPPAQLRALLIVRRADGLNLGRLARALGSSASATSRLIDRMETAGLLRRDRAASNRREILVLTTESGRRLSEWVSDQRRRVLRRILASMSPDGREALCRGLGELATRAAENA
jgi:DNA-binding MarR family transcriptional regulator